MFSNVFTLLSCFSVFCALLLESKARKWAVVNLICLCRVYTPPSGTEQSPDTH